MRKSGLILPGDDFAPIEMDRKAHLTKFGQWFFLTDGGQVPPPIAGGASFSDAYEGKVLEHIAGKTTLTLVTPVYLALATTVATDSTTGVTLVEATYTGYVRKSVTAGNFEAVSGTSPTAIKNGAELVFAACTASTSTIIGWALTDNSETAKGNIIMWGTCTSTVISTTQTPPTVAVKALEMTLD